MRTAVKAESGNPSISITHTIGRLFECFDGEPFCLHSAVKYAYLHIYIYNVHYTYITYARRGIRTVVLVDTRTHTHTSRTHTQYCPTILCFISIRPHSV